MNAPVVPLYSLMALAVGPDAGDRVQVAVRPERRSVWQEPGTSWANAPAVMGGVIPFDGRSVGDGELPLGASTMVTVAVPVAMVAPVGLLSWTLNVSLARPAWSPPG